MSINLIRRTVKPVITVTINYLILKTEFMTNILVQYDQGNIMKSAFYNLYKDVIKEPSEYLEYIFSHSGLPSSSLTINKNATTCAHAMTINVSWLG